VDDVGVHGLSHVVHVDVHVEELGQIEVHVTIQETEHLVG